MYTCVFSAFRSSLYFITDILTVTCKWPVSGCDYLYMYNAGVLDKILTIFYICLVRFRFWYYSSFCFKRFNISVAVWVLCEVTTPNNNYNWITKKYFISSKTPHQKLKGEEFDGLKTFKVLLI